MRPIVDIQLRDLDRRMAARRLTLNVTDAGPGTGWPRGYDPTYGARPLKRLIQQKVGDMLATALLSGEFSEGDTVTVDANEDGLTLPVDRPAAAARAAAARAGCRAPRAGCRARRAPARTRAAALAACRAPCRLGRRRSADNCHGGSIVARGARRFRQEAITPPAIEAVVAGPSAKRGEMVNSGRSQPVPAAALQAAAARHGGHPLLRPPPTGLSEAAQARLVSAGVLTPLVGVFRRGSP